LGKVTVNTLNTSRDHIRSEQVRAKNRSNINGKGVRKEDQNATRKEASTGKLAGNLVPKYLFEGCIFVMVPISFGNWTDRYFEEFKRWHMSGLLESLKRQTYKNFTVLTALAEPIKGSDRPTPEILTPNGSHARHALEIVQRGNCSWVLSARIDGDDLALPFFMEDLVSTAHRQIISAPMTLRSLIVAQRNYTKIFVDKSSKASTKLNCVVHKPLWSSFLSGVSQGQAVVVRREDFIRTKGHLIPLNSQHHLLDKTMANMIGKECMREGSTCVRIVHYPRQAVMYLITRLSGSFPWKSTFSGCNEHELKRQFPWINVPAILQRTRLPSLESVDACRSLQRAHKFNAALCRRAGVVPTGSTRKVVPTGSTRKVVPTGSSSSSNREHSWLRRWKLSVTRK
jgi:hypothetical protein